jgi:hypothetical protein
MLAAIVSNVFSNSIETGRYSERIYAEVPACLKSTNGRSSQNLRQTPNAHIYAVLPIYSHPKNKYWRWQNLGTLGPEISYCLFIREEQYLSIPTESNPTPFSKGGAMTAADQIKFLGDYISTIQNVYANAPGDQPSDRLVMALKIFRHDLRRRVANKPCSLDWLETLKTGVRESVHIVENIFELEAEAVSGWSIGQPALNAQQGLAAILLVLVNDLAGVIHETEKLYPELTAQFDAERIRWHQIKQEADEADRIE